VRAHENLPEASEADLAEQAATVDDAAPDPVPDSLPAGSLDSEADAADVVDQLRAVPFDEDSF
jgi:hypothetical protein